MKTNPNHRPQRNLCFRAPCARAAARLLAALLVVPLSAADGTGPGFGDLSLEELMNETVTSVSKKEEKLSDAAAAIAVLSNEDLRRFGATSVAEALRLVPGMDVAQINSSQWAISSRGFNNQFANKLLVLVDGRAVYTPLFGGVYWDLQQPMLEDLDRIEVIRGPGGTLWGANAINGVINIVSKSARDTQGTLLYGGGGDPHLTMDGARYGGQIGQNTYYRVFASYQLSNDFKQPNGQSARDGWQSAGGGFRLDHYPDPATHLTWQADATKSDLDEHASDAYNVNTLGRWTHELSDRSSVEVQAYYDRTYRNEATLSRNAVDTIDVTAQHTFGLGSRNDLIWGLGYRFIGTKIATTTPITVVRNSDFNMQLFSGFIQDEFKLIPDRLTVTAGTKIEHNDVTGFEIQPSGRVMFKPTKDQTLWAAVSRAVRTPSEVDSENIVAITLGPPFVGPGGALFLPAVTGNGNPVSETVVAYELGYRIQPTRRVSVDVAVFYNDYDHLINLSAAPVRFVPGVPFGTAEIPFVNSQSARTYGGEVVVTVEPVDHWRLTASYSLLREDFKGPLAPGFSYPADPQQKAMLRSSYDFRKASFDLQFRYVGQAGVVAAYVTADFRLAYRLTENLEFSLVGQNLLQSEHQEAVVLFGSIGGEVPRGFFAKATWRF